MELQHHAGRLPADQGGAGSEEPPEATEIDLDRATWDAEYRSKVLALLRRRGGAGTTPPEGAVPTPKRDDEQH